MTSQIISNEKHYAQDMKPEKIVYSAETLRLVRLKRRLSQKDLGLKVGASRAWINQLENDKEKEDSATVGLLKKIGAALNVEWSIPPEMENSP